MYVDRPLGEFLNDLAARKAAPGGGSASALTAVTGTSLMLMVASFTIGNPKYKDCEFKVADILVEVQKMDSELRELIDEDVSAYNKLSSALKKASASDVNSLSGLYKAAAEPPLEICEITAKCMKLCHSLAECGNKALVTDTAIAAILFEAAFFSAKFNVYINLKNVKDTDHIAKVHGILAPLEEDMPKMKEEILEICEDAIS